MARGAKRSGHGARRRAAWLWAGLALLGGAALLIRFFDPSTEMLSSWPPVPRGVALPGIGVLAAVIGVATATVAARDKRLRNSVLFTALAVIPLAVIVLAAEQIAETVIFRARGAITTFRTFQIEDARSGSGRNSGGRQYVRLRWSGGRPVSLPAERDLYDAVLARRNAAIRATSLCLRLPVETIGERARIAERPRFAIRRAEAIPCPANNRVFTRWPPRG